MYIRRKVFSLLNIEGEEKYFSTTDYTLEQKEFGRGRTAQNRKNRKKYQNSLSEMPIENINTPKNSTGLALNKTSENPIKSLEVTKQGNEISKDLIKGNNGSGLAKINEVPGKVGTKGELLETTKNTAKNLEGKTKKGVVDLFKKNKKAGIVGLAALGTTAVIGGGLYAKKKNRKENS